MGPSSAFPPPKATWLPWTHRAGGAEASAIFNPRAVFMEVSLTVSCECLAANDPQNEPAKTQGLRFLPDTPAHPPSSPPSTPPSSPSTPAAICQGQGHH